MDRTKGTGSVFRRVKRGVELPNWYIGFRDRNGRQIQESTGQSIKQVAERRLRTRLDEVDKNLPIEVSRNLKYEDIRESLLKDYAANKTGLSTRRKAVYGIAYLDEFFGNMLVNNINTPLLREFRDKLLTGELQRTVYRKTKSTDKREIKGASNATVNRIFALLRRGLNIAREDGLIHAVPKFPMLAEDNVRAGFIESEDFKKLLTHLSAYLRPLLIFLFTTGCRVGAAKLITWDMVSRDAKYFDLPGRIVKNDTNITIPLTQELTDVLLKQFRKTGSNGKPLPVFDSTNLRKEWDDATTAYGRPDLLVHDLRRSGVRTLLNSGVQEKVAMMISGHKTRSVFDRYNIVAEKQLMDAMEKVQARSGNLMEASK
jgi:integrase